jgi:hypothetical protein
MAGKDGDGFRVIDRRGQPEESEAEPRETTARKEAPGGAPEAGPGATQDPDALPAMDFSTLVLSLSTSALYHLGLVEDPETHKTIPPELSLARQTIDTLEILQEKTRGNLDEDERRLLESLLYELRMRFVDAKRRSGQPGGGGSQER